MHQASELQSILFLGLLEGPDLASDRIKPTSGVRRTLNDWDSWFWVHHCSFGLCDHPNQSWKVSHRS